MRHRNVFDAEPASSMLRIVGLLVCVVGCLLFWSVPAWASSPPAVVTGVGSAVTRTTAVLNGSVNPEGSETTYYFEYGTSPCDTATGTCGLKTASQGPVAGASVTAVESIGVRRLKPGSTYYFWVVAANAAGTVHGTEATLATLPAEEYVFDKDLEGYTFGSVAGVAVNQADGDVYAADFSSSPAAIEQFDAAGVWQSSVEIPGAVSEYDHYAQVAVDNSGIPGHEGDVYVTYETGNTVYKYDPKGSADPGDEGALVPDGITPTIGPGVLNQPTGVAVSPSGDVYVTSYGSGELSEFSPAGGIVNVGLITGLTTDKGEGGPYENGGPVALAVDAAGNIYVDVASQNPNLAEEFGTVEYTSAGVCVDPSCLPVAAGFERGVVVDPVGDVFVSYQLGGDYSGDYRIQVREYGASGERPLIENSGLEASSPASGGQLGVFGEETDGLAVNDASGALYVAERRDAAVKVFMPGKVRSPVVKSEPATSVGGLVEALNGTVDPESGEPTEYYFEYGTAPCDATAGTCGAEAVEPGEVLLTGEGSTHVSLALSGLAANTTYHYWALAANANSGVEHGEEQTFTTGPRPSEPSGETGPQQAPAGGGTSVGFPVLAGVAPVSSLPPEPVVGVAPKSLTRAQRLGRALKACTKQPRGRRRIACERQARKRYGPVMKSKKASRGGGR